MKKLIQKIDELNGKIKSSKAIISDESSGFRKNPTFSLNTTAIQYKGNNEAALSETAGSISRKLYEFGISSQLENDYADYLIYEVYKFTTDFEGISPELDNDTLVKNLKIIQELKKNKEDFFVNDEYSTDLDYAFKQNLENLIKIYDEHSEYYEKIISDEKLKQEVSIELYKIKPEDIISLEEYNKKINEIKQTFSELDKELVQDTITNYLSDFKDLNTYIAQRNIAEQIDNKKGVPEE